jgi:succinyl-diaminopimelate desuccinylase
MEALSLLSYLKQQNRKKFPISRDLRGIVKRSSQVLGKEFGMDHLSDVLTSLMFNPGVIKGGEKSNIVAQRCDLDLELRVPWGCRIDELLDGIQRHTPHGTVLTRTTHEPSITEPGCRLVAVTCDAIRHVRGGDVFPIVQWAASDARHLRGTGFRVIEYGPGNLQYLHAINEHVGTEMLEKASLVYQEILRIYSAQ